MERKEIVKRMLQNEKIFNEREKKFILKNRDIAVKIYMLSMLDTYKSVKDV